MNIKTNQAGFGRRLIANLLEISLRYAIFLPLFAIMAQSTNIPNLAYNIFLYIIVFLFFVFLFIVYDTLMTYYCYGNFGKLLTGIHVVDMEGHRLTIKRILFRNLIGYTFASLVFGLGYWTIITDKNKQAWQDKVVGSYVVTKQKFLWILALLLFFVIVIGEMMFLMQQFNIFMRGPAVIQIRNMIMTQQKEKWVKEAKEEEQKTLGKYYPEYVVSDTFYEKIETLRKVQEAKNLPEMKRQSALLLSSAKTPAEKAVAYNWMGITANETNDAKGALANYTKAVEVYPTYSTAYSNLSMVQRFDFADDINAVKNAQTAVKLTPKERYQRSRNSTNARTKK